MDAGFAIMCIDPPVGTPMMGWMDRDAARGCDGVHDSIYVRALFLRHEAERVLVLSYDVCFLGRATVERLKAAVGAALELAPRQILMAATHTHAGPAIGNWGAMRERPINRDFEDLLEAQTVRASRAAHDTARPVRIEAGVGRSKLPMNRRRLVGGRIDNAPNPQGPVCDVLPVCRFIDEDETTVCLLFSVAAHPVIFRGWDISAEFPGETIRLLEGSGLAQGAMFLLGTAGDLRPSVVSSGTVWNWDPGWEGVRAAANLLAAEVTGTVRGLTACQPRLRAELIETHWPLTPVDRAELEHQRARDDHETSLLADLHGKWAEAQLATLQSSGLPESWPILIQGIQIAEGVRLVALEGEPVAEHGRRICDAFDGGVTFALGYANGEGAYLPTSAMLPEGGYEVEGYWEYGLPSPFAPGLEATLDEALRELAQRGIR